jgi:deoxyribose-phosphate aldolase
MSSNSPAIDWKTVARAIDHTALKSDVTQGAIDHLCREAQEYGFYSVCVQPCNIAQARSCLRGSDVKVATVIGFPQGATLTAAKRFEAWQALLVGADELDMVINVGALKSGDTEYVKNDIRAVTRVAHERAGVVKVIIETSLLTRDEKVHVCELAVAAHADFVKTSTGFAGGGATVEDIALMRSIVGPKLGVKASGGIRTGADALAMLKAGASRIGSSASVQIVKELGAS